MCLVKIVTATTTTTLIFEFFFIRTYQNISCEIRLNGNVCYCLCPNIVNCTRFIICTLTGWTELNFVYCLQSETKYNCLIENWDRCHIVYYIVSIVSIYIRTSKRSIWDVECLQLQRTVFELTPTHWDESVYLILNWGREHQ